MFTKNKAEGNPNSLCNTSNTYNRLEGPWLSSVDQTSQEEWGHAPFHLQCFCCHHQTTHNTAQPRSITETTIIIIIIRLHGTQLSPAPSCWNNHHHHHHHYMEHSSAQLHHWNKPSSITETTIIIIIIRPLGTWLSPAPSLKQPSSSSSLDHLEHGSAQLHHWNNHHHHHHHH